MLSDHDSRTFGGWQLKRKPGVAGFTGRWRWGGSAHCQPKRLSYQPLIPCVTPM